MKGEKELEYPFDEALWRIVDSTGFPSVEVDYHRLGEFIQALLAEAEKKGRIEEINWFAEEYGGYNDGCGCCQTESIAEFNGKTLKYSGPIEAKKLKKRLKELSKL